MVRGLFNKNTPNKRALYVAVPRVWRWISESAHSHSCFACCLTRSKGIFEKWWTRSNVFPSLVFIYVALFQTSLIRQIWIRSNVGIRCLADPSNAYKGSQPVMGQKLWGLNRTNLILDQTQTLVIGIWILFFTTELSAKNQNLYNTPLWRKILLRNKILPKSVWSHWCILKVNERIPPSCDKQTVKQKWRPTNPLANVKGVEI